MATKKYLSLSGLTEYDSLIKKDYIGVIPDTSESATIVQYVVEQVENIGIDNYTPLDQTTAIETNLGFISEKLDLIEDEAEKNIIETISVNNVDLIPDENRKVNVEVPIGNLASKDLVDETDLNSELIAKINEKADLTGLAEISRTGNVKNLIQSSGNLLILNCGSASINI